MTINQLTAIAAKHGYRIELNDDGQPKLVPFRDGARLPDRVLWLFKSHRGLFVQTPGVERKPGEEFHTCTVCKGLVNLEFAPCFNPDMTPETFGCTRSATRDSPPCPYRGDL